MKVLLVNTKGGGHAFLGLHLAKALMSAGHQVTIMNDGDKEKLAQKPWIAQYKVLEQEGATIVWGSPTDPSTYPTGSFDVVCDNNGKDMETCQPLIDHFKGKGGVQHYIYISSAGMLKTNTMEPILCEDDPRNEKAHYFVEEYLKDQDLPYTVFRPQYLYGPYTSKDSHHWFMDRILRGRPVYLPQGTAMTLASLSHIEDMATLVASVLGNPEAVRQVFQMSSGRGVTFEGICAAIAKTAGVDYTIMYYDPKKISLARGEGVPFRTTHFITANNKARVVLDFKPQHTFLGDVAAELADYKAQGRMDKEVDFSVDDKIAATL